MQGPDLAHLGCIGSGKINTWWMNKWTTTCLAPFCGPSLATIPSAPPNSMHYWSSSMGEEQLFHITKINTETWAHTKNFLSLSNVHDNFIYKKNCLPSTIQFKGDSRWKQGLPHPKYVFWDIFLAGYFQDKNNSGYTFKLSSQPSNFLPKRFRKRERDPGRKLSSYITII